MIAFIPAFGDYVYVFNWTYRPIPLFTYTPEMPRLGDTIVFNASLSYDPDGNITSYIWDFGDGTIAEGVIVNHTFMEPGVYNVSLTVTDIDGLSSSIVYEITVAPLPVVVNVNTDARIYIDDILYGTASPGDPLEIKIKPMTGAINVTAVPLDSTYLMVTSMETVELSPGSTYNVDVYMPGKPRLVIGCNIECRV